jgi:hypothetical protein
MIETTASDVSIVPASSTASFVNLEDLPSTSAHVTRAP